MRQLDEHDQPYGELADSYSYVETDQWEQARRSLYTIKAKHYQFKYLAAASELRTQDYLALSLHDYLETSRVVYTARILKPDEALVSNLIINVRTSPTLVLNRAGKPTVDGLQTHEILGNCSDPSYLELNERILEITIMYLQTHASNP